MKIKLHYREPQDKPNPQRATTGTQANIELFKKNSKGKWEIQKGYV